jgi:hypothetical protein
VSNSLLPEKEFPVLQNIIPVDLRRELLEKRLQRSGFSLLNRATEPQNRKIPCKIPCWQGICVETVAISTPPPARQSGSLPDKWVKGAQESWCLNFTGAASGSASPFLFIDDAGKFNDGRSIQTS